STTRRQASLTHACAGAHRRTSWGRGGPPEGAWEECLGKRDRDHPGEVTRAVTPVSGQRTAVVMNLRTNPFADPAKGRAIDFEGTYYRCSGPGVPDRGKRLWRHTNVGMMG